MRAVSHGSGGGRSGTDHRPSDRAGPEPAGVALLSVHTSPLAQPGTGDGGGMNVFVAALAARLRARGLTVHVFTRSTGPDLPPTVVLDDGVQVHHIEAGPPTTPKEDLASHLCAFYLAVAAHPALDDVDLLHGHYWMSGWVGRRLKQRRGLPLVQRFHTLAHAKNAARATADTAEPMLRIAGERRVVAAADAILAPTAAEARLLRTGYRARPGQVHVVPPGVDTTVFHPDGERHVTRQQLGGGRLLLFVGRLQPLKAPDLAIRALAALDAHLPDDGLPTRLIICGGASGNGHGTTDPPALLALAESLGVADPVAVLAPRPHAELAALYRGADAVIMPSRSESFGLVALEAQACGTPVVASSVGGLPEVIGRGGGTVVADHDPDAYARALAPYLLDPRARAQASAAAVAGARHYRWDRTVDQTLDVYRGTLVGPADLSESRGA
jgi:D-inositol-3-phosphate glycosyltransferase